MRLLAKIPMHHLLALAALVLTLPAHAVVTIDWVFVGSPGNAPDTASNCAAANCGSVPYNYYISKYEVTNGQYAEFLNAKAAVSDPLELYDTAMASDGFFGGGIIRSAGSSGSYTYAVKSGFENKPVNFVSFYDALRFTNWLNNGQGSADTETADPLIPVRRERDAEPSRQGRAPRASDGRSLRPSWGR